MINSSAHTMVLCWNSGLVYDTTAMSAGGRHSASAFSKEAEKIKLN